MLTIGQLLKGHQSNDCARFVFLRSEDRFYSESMNHQEAFTAASYENLLETECTFWLSAQGNFVIEF